MSPKYLLASLALIVAATPALAADRPLRPVNTYSIVARDPATGELGVAVQSHWFSVGSVVSWAEPGVGAVATQSFVDPDYGPLGLALIRSGKSASQALTALLAADEHAGVRQVGMVDANGNVAAHTGDNAIVAHCDSAGEQYTVQANLMWKDGVCAAMVDAFEGTEADLAERLMLALEAAERAGGDIRGKQSAALLVVSGDRSEPAWAGRIYDLRVEDHADPIAELRRLLTLGRGYNLMTAGDDFVTAGDIDAANRAYAEAEALMPDNHEAVFWHAATLAGVGEIEAALPLFDRAFAMWPQWRELVPRLPGSGLLPDDPELVRRILESR